jgi:hypothetical protein
MSHYINYIKETMEKMPADWHLRPALEFVLAKIEQHDGEKAIMEKIIDCKVRPDNCPEYYCSCCSNKQCRHHPIFRYNLEQDMNNYANLQIAIESGLEEFKKQFRNSPEGTAHKAAISEAQQFLREKIK